MPDSVLGVSCSDPTGGHDPVSLVFSGLERASGFGLNRMPQSGNVAAETRYFFCSHADVDPGTECDSLPLKPRFPIYLDQIAILENLSL